MTPTLDEQIAWAEEIAETADERFACPEVFAAILATLREAKAREAQQTVEGGDCIPWVGCGQCDMQFPCFDGAQRCFRNPPEQQPVAWMQIGLTEETQGYRVPRTTKPRKYNPEWWRFEPLYAAPVAPEGWVMVPKEPTSEMLRAGHDAGSLGGAEGDEWEWPSPYNAYTAMLAAAPKEPTK